MSKSWCVFTVAVVALAAACSTGKRPKPIRMPATTVPATLRVKPDDGGPVRRVALEEYVRAAIVSEFAPPSGDPALVERMLEVQAVIARTYAASHVSRHAREGFDLCSTTHCQLYQPGRLKYSMWAAAASTAVERTGGMVLWYQSAPASAYFHADCGGHTSAANDIWGGAARPYLAATKDDGPAESAHTAWRFPIDRAALIVALNADPRTRVGKQLRTIVVTHRDGGGRAALVALGGTSEHVVRGEDLRAVLTRAFGAKSIRSTRFDVERDASGFVFVGQGYGHGVGLCQAGALARLRAGSLPEQVLARYYPGTRLVVLR